MFKHLPTDVVLVFKDGEMKSNRAFLAETSPVFERMLFGTCDQIVFICCARAAFCLIL
jgi:hypothetical protein